jgi:hypothetical protein
MKPTEDEVKTEIARLKEMKPKVRRKTAFGDDNWEKIDAQIRVLEESMDEDEIYAAWSDDNDPEHNQDLIHNALDARQWMEGDVDEPELPSKGWENLVQE